VRILHTADWHLGHTLHDLSREYEHAQFLNWLLKVLKDERVDALIIAGDIFDSANPPAAAQRMWYDFLVAAVRSMEQLQIVVVGGNHDSAERLDAPDQLLRAFKIRVIGGVPRAGSAVDYTQMLVELQDRHGTPRAIVAAVPFLRPADLPIIESTIEVPLVAAIRRIYEQTIAAGRASAGGKLALIATGHCYMTGGEISKLSERKIQCGNQHAIPVDVFPQDLAYVALGHLHRPQCVGGRQSVRYSGSPIPLSMDEAAYQHGVCIVELQGTRAEITALEIPRSVELLKIPAKPLPLDHVLVDVGTLKSRSEVPNADLWPFVEVQVEVSRYEPSLRAQIDGALSEKAARLVKLTSFSKGPGGSLADAQPAQSLSTLDPEAVFELCYKRRYDREPGQPLREAFRALLEKAQHNEEAGA